MRVDSVNLFSGNYKNLVSSKRANKQPSFNAQLMITGEAEDLMRYQAYEVSKGDTSVYTELLGGFGRFMEDLSTDVKNLKPDNATLTVDLHPKLKEFMSLPPLTRGTYKLDQLILRAGLPYMGGDTFWGYAFTYRPGNPYLLNQVVNGAKDVLKKAYH